MWDSLFAVLASDLGRGGQLHSWFVTLYMYSELVLCRQVNPFQ
jgi:hypothetical protein